MTSEDIRQRMKRLQQDERTLREYGTLSDRISNGIRTEMEGLDYSLRYEMHQEESLRHEYALRDDYDHTDHS